MMSRIAPKILALLATRPRLGGPWTLVGVALTAVTDGLWTIGNAAALNCGLAWTVTGLRSCCWRLLRPRLRETCGRWRSSGRGTTDHPAFFKEGCFRGILVVRGTGRRLTGQLPPPAPSSNRGSACVPAVPVDGLAGDDLERLPFVEGDFLQPPQLGPGTAERNAETLGRWIGSAVTLPLDRAWSHAICALPGVNARAVCARALYSGDLE
jgi:hypothetical protein